MKTTIVPAQITTVEDKIAGNISLSQLLLIMSSIFSGSALYAILPPSLSFATYKVIIDLGLVFFLCLMAIRIKGKLLLVWGIVILSYNLRPRYYVFNKNDRYLRPVINQPIETPTQTSTPINSTHLSPNLPKLSIATIVQLEQIIASPKAGLAFEISKKGAVNVSVTEIK